MPQGLSHVEAGDRPAGCIKPSHSQRGLTGSDGPVQVLEFERQWLEAVCDAWAPVEGSGQRFAGAGLRAPGRSSLVRCTLLDQGGLSPRYGRDSQALQEAPKGGSMIAVSLGDGGF